MENKKPLKGIFGKRDSKPVFEQSRVIDAKDLFVNQKDITKVNSEGGFSKNKVVEYKATEEGFEVGKTLIFHPEVIEKFLADLNIKPPEKNILHAQKYWAEDIDDFRKILLAADTSFEEWKTAPALYLGLARELHSWNKLGNKKL